MKHHQPAVCQMVAKIARNKRRVLQPNCVGFRITIAVSLRILFFMKCWWSLSETSLTSTVPDGCKDCMEFLREQCFSSQSVQFWCIDQNHNCLSVSSTFYTVICHKMLVCEET